MRKSLPLLAGAIVIPLLTATVAALAAVGGATDAPVATLPPTTPVTLEAPVQLATTTTTPVTSAPAIRTTLPHAPTTQEPAVLAAVDPETSTDPTTPEPPTATVPPNQWVTPEPTTPPPASPIPSGGPTEMAIAWDGIKCAQSESWVIQKGGSKTMCPGSRQP